MVSYLQQLCIVLFGWLVIFVTKRTWQVWYTAVHVVCNFVCRWHREPERGTSASLSALMERTAMWHKLHAAFITALYDFQRTQVFFAVTLQVTSLITLNDITWLDAVTFTQLKTGLLMIEIIGSMGVFPLSLNLITLHKDKKALDWLTLSTSVCGILLASGTFYYALSKPRIIGQLRHNGFTPEDCGNINPMQHCVGIGPIGTALVLAKSTGEAWMRLIGVFTTSVFLFAGAWKLLLDTFPHRSVALHLT